MSTVDVVIPAFGPEPLLPRACHAVLASEGVEAAVFVVDNGYTGGDRQEIEGLPGVRWLSPARNLGYAAGGNFGAAAGASPVVAVLNSDALVEPGALGHLVAALEDPIVGLVSGRVLLLREPGTVNSAGNPVHYSLLSWAGGWGDPAEEHAEPSEPASASGALLAMRRTDWDKLGGFHGRLFAYCEDVDLSLRVWQAGLRVRYVPESVVFHDYEFGRNPLKFHLLERNRWINLLTLYEPRTLLSLLPGLLVVEAGIWASSLREGWIRQKVSAVSWVITHRAQVRSRRHWVQASRVLPDTAVLPHLSSRIEPSPRAGQSVPGWANQLIARLATGVGGAGQHDRGASGRTRRLRA